MIKGADSYITFVLLKHMQLFAMSAVSISYSECAIDHFLLVAMLVRNNITVYDWLNQYTASLVSVTVLLIDLGECSTFSSISNKSSTTDARNLELLSSNFIADSSDNDSIYSYLLLMT